MDNETFLICNKSHHAHVKGKREENQFCIGDKFYNPLFLSEKFMSLLRWKKSFYHSFMTYTIALNII